MYLRQHTWDYEGKIGALSEILTPRHTADTQIFKWTINHYDPFGYLFISTLQEGKEHPTYNKNEEG
jgi:hypothetical protein